MVCKNIALSFPPPNLAFKVLLPSFPPPNTWFVKKPIFLDLSRHHPIKINCYTRHICTVVATARADGARGLAAAPERRAGMGSMAWLAEGQHVVYGVTVIIVYFSICLSVYYLFLYYLIFFISLIFICFTMYTKRFSR